MDFIDIYSINLNKIIGNPCLLCGSLNLSKSPFPLCFNCLREIVDELLFIRYKKNGVIVFSLFEYKGLIKELIKMMKFDNSRLSLFVLNQLLCSITSGKFNIQSSWSKLIIGDFDYIVPVACSRSSIRRRGWDPVIYLANSLSKKNNTSVLKLIKRGNSIQQKKLNRKERLKENKGNYYLHERISYDNQSSILLLDDVMTTGSTLEENSALIKCGEQKDIIALVIATD